MNDNEIKQNIKNSLDDLTNNIDVASQVKLNEARHAALNQTVKKTKLKAFLTLSGAAGIIMIFTLIWTQFWVEGVTSQSNVPWLEDLDILATEADPEFYQDLEFLTWLEDSQLLESDI